MTTWMNDSEQVSEMKTLVRSVLYNPIPALVTACIYGLVKFNVVTHRHVNPTPPAWAWLAACGQFT